MVFGYVNAKPCLFRCASKIFQRLYIFHISTIQFRKWWVHDSTNNMRSIQLILNDQFTYYLTANTMPMCVELMSCTSEVIFTTAHGTYACATRMEHLCTMSFWDIPGMKPGVITGDVAWNLLKHAKD